MYMYVHDEYKAVHDQYVILYTYNIASVAISYVCVYTLQGESTCGINIIHVHICDLLCSPDTVFVSLSILTLPLHTQTHSLLHCRAKVNIN